MGYFTGFAGTTTYVAVQSASTVLIVCENTNGFVEPLGQSPVGSAPAMSAASSAEPSQSADKDSAEPSTAANTKVLKHVSP